MSSQEPQPKTPITTAPSASDKPPEPRGHSSYAVWLIYTFRAIEKILPALKGKEKWSWVAPFFLCLLLLLAFVGFGIYVDGYVIHPPAQYTGVCSPPAQILKGNCVRLIITTAVVSGTTTQIVQTIQAGVILNSTAAHK